jgi:hypothetical protein
MMPAMRRGLLAVIGVVLTSAACGGGGSGKHPDAAPADADPFQDAPTDAPMLPVFRNPVDLPDDQLATKALQILGANVPNAQNECGACHGLTRQHLHYWRALSDTSMSSCLTDLQVTTTESARSMIDCLRAMPMLPTSDWKTDKLGIYATAARLPWFRYTFWKAYGSEGAAQLATFQQQVAMPRGVIPELTQEQFDIVAEWFTRGVPMLDTVLPQDPAPTICTPGISAEVAAHTQALATTGWRAVNRDNMMAMFDCGAATDPKLCLADKPLGSAQPYGTGWDVANAGHLRVLKDVTYQSSYWTRSSPDGRFVAHGVANVTGSYVIDLQRDAIIPIATQYDPAWFPDNAGFVFQGGTRNVCAQSVLTANPDSVTMTEPGCARINQIGLYQHVGRGLGGGDYFAIDSEFVSDDGGHEPTITQPDAAFGIHGYTDFSPMIFDGTKFVPHALAHVPQPYEGDSTLSPSATLEMTRVANPNDQQIGYVLRKVVATPAGTSYTVTTPEIARYCLSGGKPGFSYDERWVAFHHYVTDDDATELGFQNAADPAFAPYKSLGAANIYLLDLATGTKTRITNMAPGQYALYPHFRSDGWIYADVRDTTTAHEYIVASDAALLQEP